MIRVELLKLLLELHDLIGLKMLDENVYSSFLEERLTPIGVHSLQHLFVQFLLVMH